MTQKQKAITVEMTPEEIEAQAKIEKLERACNFLNQKKIFVATGGKGGNFKTGSEMLIADAYALVQAEAISYKLEKEGKDLLDDSVIREIKDTCQAYVDEQAFVEFDKQKDFFDCNKTRKNNFYFDIDKGHKNTSYTEFIEIAEKDYNIIWENFPGKSVDLFKDIVSPASVTVIPEAFKESGYKMYLICPIGSEAETLKSVEALYSLFGNTVQYVVGYNRKNNFEDDANSNEQVFKGNVKREWFKSPYKAMKDAGVIHEIDIPDIGELVYKEIKDAGLQFNQATVKGSVKGLTYLRIRGALENLRDQMLGMF